MHVLKDTLSSALFYLYTLPPFPLPVLFGATLQYVRAVLGVRGGGGLSPLLLDGGGLVRTRSNLRKRRLPRRALETTRKPALQKAGERSFLFREKYVCREQQQQQQPQQQQRLPS